MRGAAAASSTISSFDPANRRTWRFLPASNTWISPQIAFALAAYRRDEGGYPADLDHLAPKYLATVPLDIFSGKALNYRPAEKGYLLYSIGVNGKDEEGRWFEDEPPGDDHRVRMPLLPLKKE